MGYRGLRYSAADADGRSITLHCYGEVIEVRTQDRLYSIDGMKRWELADGTLLTPADDSQKRFKIPGSDEIFTLTDPIQPLPF
jgi:hypothetical protein